MVLVLKAVNRGLPFGILKRCSHFKCHHMSLPPGVENPKDRPLGNNILIIPNEIDFLPDITEEAIDMLLTQIVGTIEPVGSENAHLDLGGSTLSVGVESIEEGGAVVPLEVVEEVAELVLDDVEVAAVGPVVPEVDHLEDTAVVHEEHGVELVGPWSRFRL